MQIPKYFQDGLNLHICLANLASSISKVDWESKVTLQRMIRNATATPTSVIGAYDLLEVFNIFTQRSLHLCQDFCGYADKIVNDPVDLTTCCLTISCGVKITSRFVPTTPGIASDQLNIEMDTNTNNTHTRSHTSRPEGRGVFLDEAEPSMFQITCNMSDIFK